MYLLFYEKLTDDCDARSNLIEEHVHIAVSHSFDSLLETKQEICDRIKKYQDEFADWDAKRTQAIVNYKKDLRAFLKRNLSCIKNFDVYKSWSKGWIKSENEVYSDTYIYEKRNLIIDEMVKNNFFITKDHYSWKHIDEIFDVEDLVGEIPKYQFDEVCPEPPKMMCEEDCLFICEVKYLDEKK